MTFYPLDNLSIIERFLATGNKVSQVATMSGTMWLDSLTGSNVRFMNPFFAVAHSSETHLTNQTAGHTRFIASSDTNISKSTSTPTETVGTTSTVLSVSNTGWTATITVTGSEGATINCLYMVGCIQTQNGAKNTLLAALILDNPVTIGSSGSVSFAFGVEL